jgi:formamidopyrimidine-DNA glycosylase
MPELPDIAAYIETLSARYSGEVLERIRVGSPFVVRSFEPPVKAVEGKRVTGFRRIGKRVVFELSDDLFVVVHLMVAGRFKLAKHGAKVAKRLGLCAFDFPSETLMLTEASKKKRASLHVVAGPEALAAIDPGGIEVMGCGLKAFREALVRENHTLKRTMTDPHVFSGIGNAYSDEILHHCQLSPVKWTQRLSDDEITRLYASTQTVLGEWTARLVAEAREAFPKKVTAFRPEMAVHGKYKDPCPRCGTMVQRIVRGESEINYCPSCQTGGKLLADRSLSRLLRGDWPKTLEELEERKSALRAEHAAPTGKKAAKKKGGSLSDRIAALNRRPSPRDQPTKPPKKRSRAKKAAPKGKTRILFLFAPGAGAPSTSAWMEAWAERLESLGKVARFDYPYMLEGRRRPDRHDKLVTAHRAALDDARKGHRGPIVLIGKSMGSRMGCHLAADQDAPVDALVCLGYPLVGMGKTRKLRDAVLLALKTPVLFVQGTRDKLCPLETLEETRTRMTADHTLHVVETGDHSLLATKTWLKGAGKTQDDVDATILKAIDRFLTTRIT